MVSVGQTTNHIPSEPMQFDRVEPMPYKKPMTIKKFIAKKKKTPSAGRNPSAETANFLDFIARNQEHKLELYSYAVGGRKLPDGIVNENHYKTMKTAYKADVIPLRRKLQSGIGCVNDMIVKKQTTIYADDHRVGNLLDGHKSYHISELTDELHRVKDQLDKVMKRADFPLWAGASRAKLSIPFVEPPCEEACDVVMWKA